MRAFRIFLNGAFLICANFGAILVGHVTYYLSKSTNQIAVQVPVAVVLSISAFIIWSLLLRRFFTEKLALVSKRELVQTYFVALILNPVIFIPFHYIAQGYLTSLGNILGCWIFQVPTNFLAVLLAYNHLFAADKSQS